MSEITLYGSPLSLYTGRARSYLIKTGEQYTETLPNSAYYEEHVLPKMGGRRSIPAIETEEGEVIRDGAAIIDYYEQRCGNEHTPNNPKQKLVSLLFDVIGSEGLLRPAMHYRWNFPEENSAFLQFHFETFVPANLAKKGLAEKRMNQMREAGRNFGAVPQTYALIETLYFELIQKLDSHFTSTAYLLGNKPSIGDFGLIAPLYGHLGRDPKPLSIMQSQAIRLYRWVERMNRPDLDMGEFSAQNRSYLEADEIPDTLIDVLKQLAIDFMPETKAACAYINTWIGQQNSLPPNTIAERGVGMCNFNVHGVSITALAQPYRFYLLSRTQQEFEKLDQSDKDDVLDLFAKCNMREIFDLKLDRQIGRHDNREGWL